MLCLAVLSFVINSIMANPSEKCNHFLGSPVDRCDFQTSNGRYYGLFCVADGHVEGRTFSDSECSEDMRIGHIHDCEAPYCNCNGTSNPEICPITTIAGSSCPGAHDLDDFAAETWTHVRDICVAGPQLNSSVKSSCFGGAIVYNRYEDGQCKGVPKPLTCIGKDACGECEDYVEFGSSASCPPEQEVVPVVTEMKGDCCAEHFKTEKECKEGLESVTNCSLCGWNVEEQKCVFQSRLSPKENDSKN